MFSSPVIKRKKKASRFGFSILKVSIFKDILAKECYLTSTKEASIISIIYYVTIDKNSYWDHTVLYFKIRRFV